MCQHMLGGVSKCLHMIAFATTCKQNSLVYIWMCFQEFIVSFSSVCRLSGVYLHCGLNWAVLLLGFAFYSQDVCFTPLAFTCWVCLDFVFVYGAAAKQQLMSHISETEASWQQTQEHVPFQIEQKTCGRLRRPCKAHGFPKKPLFPTPPYPAAGFGDLNKLIGPQVISLYK